MVNPCLFLGAVFLQQALGLGFLMNALYPWTPNSVASKLVDVLVLLGPLLALALTAMPVVRVQWHAQAHSVVTLSLRKARRQHYRMVLFSLGLLGLFGAIACSKMGRVWSANH